MANPNQRTPQNVPGAYYVDDTCIDCDLCRTTAPRIFRRRAESGYTYVFHQPASPEEQAEAEEGLDACPTDSIGSDGNS